MKKYILTPGMRLKIREIIDDLKKLREECWHGYTLSANTVTFCIKILEWLLKIDKEMRK